MLYYTENYATKTGYVLCLFPIDTDRIPSYLNHQDLDNNRKRPDSIGKQFQMST